MKMFFLMSLLVTASMVVKAQDLCPNRINTEQNLKEDIPLFEIMLDQANNSLKDVSFFYGHPSEMSSLMPDENASKDKERIMTWNFDEPEKIYVACSYTDSKIILIRNIKIYNECVVIHDLTRQFSSGSYVLKSAICK